jgi:hypothetical protein
MRKWSSRLSRRRAVSVTGLALVVSAVLRVSAHEVPVERVVEMFVLPQGDRLTVLVRLPASVLADAGLPRLPDESLDSRPLDRPLRLVAADFASGLEMRQDEAALPQPTVTALVSPGSDASFASPAAALAHMRGASLPAGQPVDTRGAFVDLELRYPIRAESRRFSARLNDSHAAGPLTRTVAHYVLPTGQVRTLSVSGPPDRAAFDPDAWPVAQQFAQRALAALLDASDQLLLLVCLLVPVREARIVARRFAALAVGYTVSIAASAARIPLSPETLAMVAMVASSALVVAAVQNLVGARERWVWPLALGVGALSGIGLGHRLSLAAPLAGAHVVVAAVVFVFVVAAGQAWIAALLWATRAWLDERGLPRMATTVVLSVWIAHSAVHQIVDRGVALEQAGLFSFDRTILALALVWAAVMVAVAAAEALGGSSRRTHPASAGEAR